MADDPRKKANPETINDALLTAGITHQLGLERVAGGLRNDMIEAIESKDDELMAAIEERIDEIANRDNPLALRAAEEATADINSEVFENVQDVTNSELGDIAEWENEYQTDNINKIIGLSLIASLAAPDARVVANQPINSEDNVRTAEQWVESIRQSRQRNINTVLQDTYQAAPGEIKSTEAVENVKQKIKQSRHHADVVSQTTVSGVTIMTREKLYDNNRDIIDRVQWVSVLDSRTSAICSSRDTNIYPINQGPRPPAHAHCRSETIPLMKKWEDWGMDRQQIPREVRRRATGKPATAVSYEDWLKQQPYYRIEETLGVQRAKLYVHGNLDFEDLITSRGKPLTLEKLKIVEREAWEKAEENAPKVAQLKRSRTLRKNNFSDRY